MKNTIQTLTTLGAVMILTACGGGGGTDVVFTQPENIAVSGTAVDDLILNGKVKVLKPDNALLVEGRTSATNGTYTLNVANYTGATVVNVTCDSDSKILVGTTEEACPADLNLNSVANINGTAVTINISPLTDIVYQRAVSIGGGQITEDSVTDASNEISLMFGVDPIQNDPTTGTYAAIIDAFHAVADADPERDLFDVIDDFVVDVNDGVVDNSAALIDALEAENITNPLTESGDTGYVIPSNPASNDDVAEVKEMVQALRTQVTTLKEYGDSEADAIGVALESTAIDIGSATNDILAIADLITQARENGDNTLSGVIEEGIGYVGDNLAMIPMKTVVVTQSAANPDNWTYTMALNSGESYAGEMSMPALPEGIEYDFTTLNGAFSGNLPYKSDTDYFNPVPNIQTQKVALTLALSKTTAGANVVLTDYTIENSDNTVSIDSLTGSVSYSEPTDPDADPIFNYVKLDAVTLTANVGDYTATGTLSVPEYAVNTSLEGRGGVQENPVTFPQTSISCSSPATINNPNAMLSIDGTEYTYVNYYTMDSTAYFLLASNEGIPGTFTSSEIEAGTTTTSTCSDSSTPIISAQFTFNDTDELIGNSGIVPKIITFTGNVKNTVTNGELIGTVNIDFVNAVTVDLSTDGDLMDTIALKVDIAAKMIMPQRPETLLNLTYETQVDDDAHRHSITGSYNYDTTLITISGSADKSLSNADLTFTNGSGVNAVFIITNEIFVNGNVATSTGSLVTKDGKVVATIEEREDNIIIIKYLDGSFESIF